MEMNKSITIPVETVGQAYLEILRARGIKYFFGNSADIGHLITASAAHGGNTVVVINLLRF